MKKQIIKTYEQYMNAISYPEVATEKIELPFLDARVGKKGKFWFVFEFNTGRIINSVPCKTKAEAIEKAKKTLDFYGAEATSQAIAKYPILNTL